MKVKTVTSEELEEILRTHNLICKCTEIDEETGHKTKYYMVKPKTEQEKYDTIIQMDPFKNKRNL
jgi:hypothetical protein